MLVLMLFFIPRRKWGFLVLLGGRGGGDDDVCSDGGGDVWIRGNEIWNDVGDGGRTKKCFFHYGAFLFRSLLLEPGLASPLPDTAGRARIAG